MKSFIFIVWALTCLPFGGVGSYEIYENFAELAGSARAQGTVTGNRYSPANVDGTVSGAYHPVVEFRDARGETIAFIDGVGSLPPDYEIGARVEVLFAPAAPRRARIHSWKRLWLAPAVLTTVGFLPLVGALFMARRLKL